MKKKIISIAIVTTILTFSGCRNAERETSHVKASESISYSHEFDAVSNSHEDLFAISYQIPLSWDCSNADSGYYYYPENGMLYVSTDASPFQVTESDKQNNFIDGFSSNINEFQEIDRYTTDIAGIDTLVFEFSGMLSQEPVNGKSYVFTYNDLLYCFIYSDFITESTYISHMKDFEEIINSISFTPLANEESSKEAEINFSKKSDADTELSSENNTTDNEVLEQENAIINSPTISMSEFNSLSDGMSYEEASTLIGSNGTILSESGSPGDEYYTVIYSWSGEGSIGANANVTFQGNKLVNKAQYGLE